MKIGSKNVGSSNPCFIIAEIGINHNGSLEIAKQLIDVAVEAGCDAVKFQMRTVDVVYTAAELEKPRETPFGTTNGDLKRHLEFNIDQYKEINQYCKHKDIMWTASPWDIPSVERLFHFDVPFVKVASASITDLDLLSSIAKIDIPVVLSTGMSTIDEVYKALDCIGIDNTVLMHTNSTYPTSDEELNLRTITTLKDTFGVCVGYSGHEKGIATSVAAVVLGACVLERHITLDRTMFGSDQSASLEPSGLKRLVRDIRCVECALGDGVKRVYESEIPVRDKLRRVK